jgi:integrase
VYWRSSFLVVLRRSPLCPGDQEHVDAGPRYLPPRAQAGEAGRQPDERARATGPEGRRDRIASPAEAAELLAALPEAEPPLWATAFYAGLRRGELLALRFEDVEFAGGVIRVERAYDPKARVYVEPKSRAGRRSVPLAGVLREYLAAQRLRAGRPSLVAGHLLPANEAEAAERFDASLETANG